MSKPKLDRLVAFRLTTREHQAIHAAAEAAGLSLSQWLRLVALTATGNTTLIRQLERLIS
jgi:predicted HicB family RNase H-like nuclease